MNQNRPWSEVVPTPDVPLKVALIGAGNRSRTVYQPLFDSLKPWIEIVAVCDPVREHADAIAGKMGIKAYYNIHELVADKPMEAALIITPVPSHHSITVFLASHGIHCHTETSWCSMVCQAQEMIDTARENMVIVRVAENFLRFPVDRFAQAVRDYNYLGPIQRIFSYNSHTGYHNNSRWIAFAQSHPLWVQSVEHVMPHPTFYSMPQRYHNQERFHARFFMFPENLMVIDQASNVKCWLGRQPRNGYEEWQGPRGTLVHQTLGHVWGEGEITLRHCSDAQFANAEDGWQSNGGIADQITPVQTSREDGNWICSFANTPEGRIEYHNPFRSVGVGKIHMHDWYGIAIMDHIVDFALAVRGLRESEFTDEDAMMSLMMDVGAHESVQKDGKRIELPLAGELESDARVREAQKAQFGVDPMDVEGMLAISYSRP